MERELSILRTVMNAFVNPKKRSITLPSGCKDLADVLPSSARGPRRLVETLYDEGRTLFLKGKLAKAIECFTRIYEKDALFRDVASIVEDYCKMSRRKWATKYRARFYTSK